MFTSCHNTELKFFRERFLNMFGASVFMPGDSVFAAAT